MIENIAISNLRGLDHVMADLKPQTLILGKTGAGKTSILNAIRLVLTGKCPWVEARSNKLADLIGPSDGDACVFLTLVTQAGQRIQVEYIIGRQQTRFEVSDCQSGNVIAKSREELWALLGWSRDDCEVALNAGRFVQNPDDLGNAMVSLLGADMSVDQAVAYTQERGHTNRGLLDKLRSRADERLAHLTRKPNDRDWEIIGNAAYEDRVKVNRDIKEQKATLEGMGFQHRPTDTDGNDIEPEQRGEIEQMLDALSVREDKLKAELAVAENASRRTFTDAEDADELRKEFEERKEQFERESEASTKCNDEVTALDKELVPKRHKQIDIDKEVARRAATINTLKEQLGALDCEDCPTCKRKMTKAAREAALQPTQERIEALTQEVDDLRSEYLELNKDLGVIGSRMESLNETADEHAKAAAVEREAMERLRNRIQQAERALDATKTRPLAEIESDLEAIQERIREGSEKLKALNGYIEYTAAKAYILEREAHVEFLTFLAESFGSKCSSKKKLFQQWCLKDPVSNLVERCNETLAPTGYYMGFAVTERGIALALRRGHGPVIRLAGLSSGQQCLAELAIAVEFGRTGGVGAVDNIDRLDGDLRIAFQEMLESARSAQLIAASVMTHPGDAPLDAIRESLDGAELIWIEDGKAEAIAAA